MWCSSIHLPRPIFTAVSKTFVELKQINTSHIIYLNQYKIDSCD